MTPAPTPDKWADTDYESGRMLILVGGVVAGVGSLIGMTVKDRRGKSQAGRLVKAAAFVGGGLAAWAMLDSSGRQQLFSELKTLQQTAAQAQPPPEGAMPGLSSGDPTAEADLAARKREVLRQRAILAGQGLGPMAEPLHTQKVVERLQHSTATPLPSQGFQDLPQGQIPAMPRDAIDPTKKVRYWWAVPAAVGALAIGGTLLMKG